MTAIDSSANNLIISIDTKNQYFSTDNHPSDHAVIILASGLSQRLGTSKQLLTFQGQSLLQIMLNTALATHPQMVVVVVPEVDMSNLEESANSLTNSVKGEVIRVVDDYDLQADKIQVVANAYPESGMGHSLYLAIERLTQLHQPPKHNDAKNYSTKNDTTKNDTIKKGTTNNAAAYFNQVIIMGVDQILLQSSHLNALLAVNKEVVASSYAKDYKILSTDIDHANPTIKPIKGLPIAISFRQLVSWHPQLTGDVGLRHLLRALPADKIATIDNLKLSLDIDTPQQRQFAIKQGWLDP